VWRALSGGGEEDPFDRLWAAATERLPTDYRDALFRDHLARIKGAFRDGDLASVDDMRGLLGEVGLNGDEAPVVVRCMEEAIEAELRARAATDQQAFQALMTRLVTALHDQEKARLSETQRQIADVQDKADRHRLDAAAREVNDGYIALGLRELAGLMAELHARAEPPNDTLSACHRLRAMALLQTERGDNVGSAAEELAQAESCAGTSRARTKCAEVRAVVCAASGDAEGAMQSLGQVDLSDRPPLEFGVSIQLGHIDRADEMVASRSIDFRLAERDEQVARSAVVYYGAKRDTDRLVPAAEHLVNRFPSPRNDLLAAIWLHDGADRKWAAVAPGVLLPGFALYLEMGHTLDFSLVRREARLRFRAAAALQHRECYAEAIAASEAAYASVLVLDDQSLIAEARDLLESVDPGSVLLAATKPGAAPSVEECERILAEPGARRHPGAALHLAQRCADAHAAHGRMAEAVESMPEAQPDQFGIQSLRAKTLVDLCVQAGERDRAQTAIESLRVPAERAWVPAVLRVHAALAADDAPAAEKLAEEALADWPRHPEVLAAAFVASSSASDWPAALGYARRLREVLPHNPQTLRWHIAACANTGTWGELLEAYQQAEEGLQAEPRLRTARAHALIAGDRVDEALQELEAVRDSGAATVADLVNLAQLRLVVHGDHHRAQAIALEARDKCPTTPEPYLVLTTIAESAGDLDGAFQWAKQGYQALPADDRIATRLFVCAHQADREDDPSVRAAFSDLQARGGGACMTAMTFEDFKAFIEERLGESARLWGTVVAHYNAGAGHVGMLAWAQGGNVPVYGVLRQMQETSAQRWVTFGDDAEVEERLCAERPEAIVVDYTALVTLHSLGPGAWSVLRRMLRQVMVPSSIRSFVVREALSANMSGQASVLRAGQEILDEHGRADGRLTPLPAAPDDTLGDRVAQACTVSHSLPYLSLTRPEDPHAQPLAFDAALLGDVLRAAGRISIDTHEKLQAPGHRWLSDAERHGAANLLAGRPAMVADVAALEGIARAGALPAFRDHVGHVYVPEAGILRLRQETEQRRFHEQVRLEIGELREILTQAQNPLAWRTPQERHFRFGRARVAPDPMGDPMALGLQTIEDALNLAMETGLPLCVDDRAIRYVVTDDRRQPVLRFGTDTLLVAANRWGLLDEADLYDYLGLLRKFGYRHLPLRPAEVVYWATHEPGDGLGERLLSLLHYHHDCGADLAVLQREQRVFSYAIAGKGFTDYWKAVGITLAALWAARVNAARAGLVSGAIDISREEPFADQQVHYLAVMVESFSAAAGRGSPPPPPQPSATEYVRDALIASGLDPQLVTEALAEASAMAPQA